MNEVKDFPSCVIAERFRNARTSPGTAGGSIAIDHGIEEFLASGRASCGRRPCAIAIPRNTSRTVASPAYFRLF